MIPALDYHRPPRLLIEAYQQADRAAAEAYKDVSKAAPDLTPPVVLRSAHDFYFRPDFKKLAS